MVVATHSLSLLHLGGGGVMHWTIPTGPANKRDVLRRFFYILPFSCLLALLFLFTHGGMGLYHSPGSNSLRRRIDCMFVATLQGRGGDATTSRTSLGLSRTKERNGRDIHRGHESETANLPTYEWGHESEETAEWGHESETAEWGLESAV